MFASVIFYCFGLFVIIEKWFLSISVAPSGTAQPGSDPIEVECLFSQALGNLALVLVAITLSRTAHPQRINTGSLTYN